MRTIILVLALLASSSWAKGSKPIDDPSDLTARSWLVADADNLILSGKDTMSIRPMASITKVMTVLTVIEAKLNLDEAIAYNKSLLMTRRELVDIAMVRSDNHAAELLCKTYPGGYDKCIADMNANAVKWGMLSTSYVDATGLLPGNTSTAEDLLKLLNIAETNQLIVNSAKKTTVEIRNKKRWLIFKQTNPLVGHQHEFVVSKTGTTNAAGGCIILTVKTERGLRRVVVLGSKNGRTRIPEAEFVFKSR